MNKTTTDADELSVHLDDPGDVGRVLVTSSPFDFASFRDRRRADLGPGHAMDALATCLGARVVQPDRSSAARRDRLAARVVGQPQHWQVARSLMPTLADGDLVYATGSDSGLPIGLLAAIRRRRIKLAVHYTAPHRLRPRAITQLLSKLGVDLLPVTGADDKVATVDGWNLGRSGVLASEQTDTAFFRPLRTPTSRSTPLVTSCGLEQRDYTTLTDAIGGMDVEVKVCAASPNFTDATVVAMPDVLPENVEIRRFEFAELRSLYQEAAVTVIPLLANEYSAGMTTMMEAIACLSPVVITANPGLAADFAERDLVVGVPPGDAEAMREAITSVIDNPEAARARAKRARSYLLQHHSTDRFVESLCGTLTAFHAS